MTDIPVFYDVNETNIQLPSGFPGLTGRLNTVDLSNMLEGPNAGSARDALAPLAAEGVVRGRGLITPVATGFAFVASFYVYGSEVESGTKINIPTDAIPEPTSINKIIADPVLPYGDNGSDFAATFTVEQVNDDGDLYSTGSPSLAYDAADVVAANPSSVASPWAGMTWQADTTSLNLVLSSVTTGTGPIDALAPLIVHVFVGTNLWN